MTQLPFARAVTALAACLSILSTLLPATAGAQQASGEPIRIGAVVSLTGPGAGLGNPERHGIQLAEKYVNEHGGIKGRPIKVLIEDDGSKADIAKTKAEGLVFGEKVRALVGGSLTASTSAMSAVTVGEGLPQVACTGMGPAAEATYKTLFHVMPPQHLNARAMLEYATKSLGAKKIGVLHDTGYGQLIMNNLQKEGGAFGVEFVATEKFEVGATDATTQAAKVKATKPDVVFVVATSAVPFRNARQIGIKQPIVSAIGSSSYEYTKAMGEFADDIVFPEFLVSEDPLQHQKEFVEAYRKAYDAPPKNYEAAGWDALMAIAQALRRAGPDAPSAEIAAALRAPYAGVLANFNFGAADMTGIELGSYVYSKLAKGSFTRLPFKAGK